MTFLLDTNAVSEPQKPKPDQGYLAWIEAQAADSLNVSVLTVGELRRGLLALPVGARRSRLEAWMIEALTAFGERILPIDLPIVTAWADLGAHHKRLGRVVSAVDELVAATALAHDLTVVTRNVRDFETSGCKLLSPWSD